MTAPACDRWCRQCHGTGSVRTDDPRPGDRDTCPAAEAREEDAARRQGRDGYPPNAWEDHQ